MLGDKTIRVWIDGTANKNPGPSGAGVFTTLGSTQRRLTAWWACGRGTNQTSELNALQLALGELIAKYKEERLSNFEVLHIISDSKDARRAVVEEHQNVLE